MDRWAALNLESAMADRIESKILLFHQSADCPGVIVGERGAYGCADAETDFR